MQDFERIETPENVELEQRLAGIGSRLAAGLLDHLLLLLTFLILLLVGLFTAPSAFGAPGGAQGRASLWGMALMVLVGFAIYWGYFVFFELRSNGQSPGKRWLKLRVVREGGGAITFSEVAIRNLLRPIDGLVGYTVAGTVMFLSRKVQRLGDLAAGTVVISEQTPDYSARADRHRLNRQEVDMGPASLRATGLTPAEYRVLANYWMRRYEFTIETRARLLPGLLIPVLERVGQRPADVSLEALEKHLADLFAEASRAREDSRGAGS